MRVDPAGGGTDAPPFSHEHGGAIVNFAIARYAWAQAERLDAGTGLVLSSRDLGAAHIAETHADLPTVGPLQFLAAFLRRLVPEGDSLLLTTESDVPPGSGLGGSGALGVAVVAAIDRAYGRTRSQLDTALIANEIERRDLGFPGGDQDSFAAAFGGLNRLDYEIGEGTKRRVLRVNDTTRRALEYGGLLLYTGAAHISGSIHADIRASYEQPGSPTLAALEALRDEAVRMTEALEMADLARYAASMQASCEHLYRLHPSCDSADHRAMCEALDGLVIGRKTCGAGGGGFLLVHIAEGQRSECIRRAEELGARVWPLKFDTEGVVSWEEPRRTPEEIAHELRAASM